jgi:hypothetical protein
VPDEPTSITPGQYLWLLRLLKGEAVNRRRQSHHLILDHFGVSQLDDVSFEQASQWIQTLCHERKGLG